MAQLVSSMRNSIVARVKLWSRVPPGRRARQKQAVKQLTTSWSIVTGFKEGSQGAAPLSRISAGCGVESGGSWMCAIRIVVVTGDSVCIADVMASREGCKWWLAAPPEL